MNTTMVKSLLKQNITKTIGCTDIGVVGYIASIGADIVGHRDIKSIHLLMSDELYKNSVNVGIPGLRKSGLKHALALGFMIKDPKKQMSVFEDVATIESKRFETFLKEIPIHIEHQKFDDKVLYIALEIETVFQDIVKVMIQDQYENVVYASFNDQRLTAYEHRTIKDESLHFEIASYDDLYDFVQKKDFSELNDLFEIAKQQYDTAREEMKLVYPNMLCEKMNPEQKACPMSISNCLKAHIEVLSKKRMIGDIVTIYGVAGSGNLGIGTLVTAMFLSDVFSLDDIKRKQMIILAFLTSVYVKQGMQVVTVLCGTGHATGASSAACYSFSQDGNLEQVKDAINLYLSSSMGFICDGAKVSCTYKISFAAMNGMIAANMVMDQNINCDGFGLNKMNLDDTIKNLSKLNNEILNGANKGIISLI
jgi:L-cysteine desulfidase